MHIRRRRFAFTCRDRPLKRPLGDIPVIYIHRHVFPPRIWYVYRALYTRTSRDISLFGYFTVFVERIAQIWFILAEDYHYHHHSFSPCMHSAKSPTSWRSPRSSHHLHNFRPHTQPPRKATDIRHVNVVVVTGFLFFYSILWRWFFFFYFTYKTSIIIVAVCER